MTKIQLRHDTAANFASENPILLAGEAAIETDTNKMKIGDGTTVYNSLEYFGGDVDLSNYIQKTDVAYPTIYGSKTPVTVNSSTGVIRVNPVGNLSTPAYFPSVDASSGIIVVPTTARGNTILDKNQVLGYYGSIVDTNITFPNQFIHNNDALTYVIIGYLDESTGSFVPGLVCTNDNLYSFELVQTGNIVSNGVTCTAYVGVLSPFTSTTSGSEQTNNSMEIREGANNTLDIAAVLKQASGASSGNPSAELVYNVSITNASYNCAIFGLITLNNRYYYEDFTITDTDNTVIWKPTSTSAQSYLNISIGSGLSVSSSGQLINTNPTAPTVMTGATSSTTGTSGLVPIPHAGDNTKFLSGDGTFKTVSATVPSNMATTNTAQTISGRKTFTGANAIYFKQNTMNDKLGFTLYSPSPDNRELGAFEYRPRTINEDPLININTSYDDAFYIGFRYWGIVGPTVNIVAPKVATAGTYYIPTQFTDGTNTVTASNDGTVDMTTLLPDVSNKVTGTGITNITKLTQAEYDALATKDANTFYVIVAASSS